MPSVVYGILGLATGAIWGRASWGAWWTWDPRLTLTLILWMIYAAYLHARATAGWRGRPAAIIAIVGLAAFLFSYFGVNIFATGLHSYSGI